MPADFSRFWNKFSSTMDPRAVTLAYDTLIAYKTSQISEAQCDLCMRYLLIHHTELYDEYYELMAPSRPFSATPMGTLPFPHQEPELTLDSKDQVRVQHEPTPSSKFPDVSAEIGLWMRDI